MQVPTNQTYFSAEAIKVAGDIGTSVKNSSAISKICPYHMDKQWVVLATYICAKVQIAKLPKCPRL